MQQGGTRIRKKPIPRPNRGFNRLESTIKTPQRKDVKKRSTAILPRAGKIPRAFEKIRAESPYTQIRAPIQIMAKAKRLEANIIRPVHVSADRGE